METMIIGFFLLIVSGFFQGSFGLGYKKYPPFTWAAFWGIYSIFCMAVPALAAFMFADRIEVSHTILPFLCGALWGLSAIGFSKAIGKIGMSMVYGISMGISIVVGSVLPVIMNPKGNPQWTQLLIGYTLTLAGISLITAAGVKRDGKIKNSALGMILAFCSGLGSGAMNIGYYLVNTTGNQSYLTASAVKWLPVLLGGGIMGVIWCFGELCITRGFYSITERGAWNRCGILFVVSIVWYSALLLYGVAINMLGGEWKTTGWLFFNALALIVSIVWGIVCGEWKGHSKKLLFSGCILLITAWIFIGG